MHAPLIRLLPFPLVLALAAAAPAGVVVDDFTGDGPLDLVVSEGGAVRMLALDKNGAAADVTGPHGLDGVTGAGELRAVDADDDGRLDLLVLPADGIGALRLLVRDDQDRFRDATGRSGLAGVESAVAAAFADLDLDGHLDLLVGTAGEAPGVRVWMGAGDGTFRETTAASGLAADAPCVGIAAGDVDMDDVPDVYLSLRGAPNALWRNAGDGTFIPVEGAAALAQPAASGVARILDYDNDRDWDLFVTSADGGAPRLFENGREEGWTDVTAERGLDGLSGARRLAFGDLDNDGYEELIVETADAVTALRNARGRRFEPMGDDDPAALSLAPGGMLAVGDLDYDGDQDVLVSAAIAADGTVFGPGAHRTPDNDNLWVSVAVRGASGNRHGAGSTVRVLTVDDRGSRRDYFRRVGEDAVQGGSLRADFGLGRADRIVRVEVYFPAAKQWQSYYHPKYEVTLIVKEGAGAPETVFRGVPTAGRRL